MPSPPTDFYAPTYLQAIRLDLCNACLTDAPLTWYVHRTSDAGDHLPNLVLCRECHWETVRACLMNRECVVSHRIGERVSPAGVGAVPAAGEARQVVMDWEAA